MDTEDIPPTTLKPVPLTVACEIVSAEVPVLLKVSVCEPVDPVATFPKLRLLALAESVPVELEEEFEVESAGLVAPVKPTQPEMDSTATSANSSANSPSGARR